MSTAKDRFPITPFAGQKFSTWSFRLKSILRENNVLVAIEKESYGGDESNKTNEAKAQAIIIAAVADSHLEYVKRKTAFDMYNNLQENFQKKGVRSKLFLRRKLSEMKYKEGNPLIEHFNNMEVIFSELEEADTTLSEEEKINYILLSMPKSYDGIITALETVSDLKLDFVKNRLLGEEEKRHAMPLNVQQHMGAFSCFICGKPGHRKFQCNQRGCGQHVNQYAGRGQGQRYWNQTAGQVWNQTAGRGQGQSWNQAAGRGWSQNAGQRQERGWNQAVDRGQGRGSSHQGRGRQAYSVDSESKDVAFSVENNSSNVTESEPDSIEWCIDSGCSDHLINNKNIFIDYIELKEPRLIAAAKNNVTLQAVGIGNIKVKCFVGQRKVTNCTIKNVYYVPQLRRSLLSVSKMEAAGLAVTFQGGKVRV